MMDGDHRPTGPRQGLGQPGQIDQAVRIDRQNLDRRACRRRSRGVFAAAVFSGILGLIALVNFPDALLLLRLHEIGFSATQVLLVYMLFNFAMTLVAFPAGMLADRLPKSRVYAIGLLCFAIGYLGLGLVDGGPLVVLALFVYCTGVARHRPTLGCRLT